MDSELNANSKKYKEKKLSKTVLSAIVSFNNLTDKNLKLYCVIRLIFGSDKNVMMNAGGFYRMIQSREGDLFEEIYLVKPIKVNHNKT